MREKGREFRESVLLARFDDDDVYSKVKVSPNLLNTILGSN